MIIWSEDSTLPTSNLKYKQMKTNIKLLTSIFLAVAILGLVGCNKDDKDKPTPPPPVAKSYFKIDGKSYDLSQGFLIHNDNKNTKNGMYVNMLALWSEGISVTIDSTNTFLTGAGNGLAFEMCSETYNGFDNQEYNYDSTGDLTIGHFGWAEYAINYNIETEEADAEVRITNGKVQVAKNGDVYIIHINCTDKNGKEVTGFYQGKLSVLDMLGKSNQSLYF